MDVFWTTHHDSSLNIYHFLQHDQQKTIKSDTDQRKVFLHPSKSTGWSWACWSPPWSQRTSVPFGKAASSCSSEISFNCTLPLDRQWSNWLMKHKLLDMWDAWRKTSCNILRPRNVDIKKTCYVSTSCGVMMGNVRRNWMHETKMQRPPDTRTTMAENSAAGL